ncbi:hypothetical protein FACS1894130_06040 [Spirochaetia bacterium]|nr:hypothetical protein FACS1894130_06040 [Spirochaetia bacterium]
MQNNKDRYTVTEMASLFGVSRSACYRWVTQGVSDRRAIQQEHHGRYVAEDTGGTAEGIRAEGKPETDSETVQKAWFKRETAAEVHSGHQFESRPAGVQNHPEPGFPCFPAW